MNAACEASSSFRMSGVAAPFFASAKRPFQASTSSYEMPSAMGRSPRAIRSRAGPSSRCQPEMWATMSRALHVPSHTWRICASSSPAITRLNRVNSVSASLIRVVFSDMGARLLARCGSGEGSRRDALVEEQLADPLGQVVDVAARLKAERAVHLDGHRVGLLGGGKEPRGGRHRLHRLEELARDALAAEVV